MRRAVLCDLGGVVIRIDPDRIRSGWARSSSLSAAEVHRAFPDDVYDRFERDEISEAEYIRHVQEQLDLDASDDEILAAFNDIFLEVDEDTIRVLQGLRDGGVLVLALTNTNRTHHEVWSRRFAGALEIFDEVHCSHELRARKPEPEVFRRVLDEHALQPDEVVFIDDTPGHVEAARAVGLEAIVFTDASALAERLGALGWEEAAPRTRLGSEEIR